MQNKRFFIFFTSFVDPAFQTSVVFVKFLLQRHVALCHMLQVRINLNIKIGIKY